MATAKQSRLGLAAFAATLAIGLSAEAPTRAAPIDRQGAVLTEVVFAPYLFGGRQFCWYDSAWSGPGWYWCGYAWRNGLGWGGPRGWHGWHERGHLGGDFHGGAHFAGGVGHVRGGHMGGGVGHIGGGHVGGPSAHVGGGAGHLGGGQMGGGGHMGGGHMGGGGHIGGGGHMGGGGHGGGGHGGGGGGHH